MINRRLYLESPIQLQGLLIVPYKLGTIVVENNKRFKPCFRERKTITVTYQHAEKTIATKKTITTRKTIRTGTNNNRCPQGAG